MYFEMINYIHIFLREKGIYLEFGHASIWLIILMILAYLTAIILIILFFLRRKNRTGISSYNL
jgi:hypothetical protein